jgi:hypothetical protein
MTFTKCLERTEAFGPGEMRRQLQGRGRLRSEAVTRTPMPALDPFRTSATEPSDFVSGVLLQSTLPASRTFRVVIVCRDFGRRSRGITPDESLGRPHGSNRMLGGFTTLECQDDFVRHFSARGSDDPPCCRAHMPAFGLHLGFSIRLLPSGSKNTEAFVLGLFPGHDNLSDEGSARGNAGIAKNDHLSTTGTLNARCAALCRMIGAVGWVMPSVSSHPNPRDRFRPIRAILQGGGFSSGPTRSNSDQIIGKFIFGVWS